jgi:Calcineurin-like phosphoesterase
MSVSVADKFRRAAAPAAFSAPPSALQQILRRRPVTPGPTFQPLPAPVGRAPYRRRLADVLTAAQLEAIEQTGELRFHCVGDTGGWRDPRPQRHVAAAMVDELAGPAPVDFFYHLGDVIYPHGEEANYGAQFFSPYAAYDAPIFAIPGNHDGEAVRSRTSSLEPFVKTFCSSAPRLHDAAITVRWPPSHQPHVFWTLVHDWSLSTERGWSSAGLGRSLVGAERISRAVIATGPRVRRGLAYVAAASTCLAPRLAARCATGFGCAERRVLTERRVRGRAIARSITDSSSAAEAE